MDSTEKVIETAIEEALRHYRYPTAYALRVLWDEHSADAAFVTMVQDVFTQSADPETMRRFSRMIEKTKRQGKKNEAGFVYFEQPRSGSLSQKQKALAAPYVKLIQRPATATATDEQEQGEMRPTKKIKIIHSGAGKDKSLHEDASVSASVSATAATAATAADTCITKTLPSRRRGRRHSGSSESSLSSAMSLSSPEMTHRGHHGRSASGHQGHLLASPSARPKVKINKSKARARASAANPNSRPQPPSLQATDAPNTPIANGLQAPNALQSNGSAPKTGPISTARRQSLASDQGQGQDEQDQEQDQDVDQDVDQDQQELHYDQDRNRDPSQEQQPSFAGLDDPSSPMHSMSRPHHHTHHNNNNTTITTSSSFLSTSNVNLDPHSNSPSPPQSPTTAVVEERQRQRQQDKIQSTTNKQDHHSGQDAKQLQILQKQSPQDQVVVSKAPSPLTAADGRDAVADASMPGLIIAPDHPPPQEVATRRCEAKKITNGYTAAESSVRDASLLQRLSLSMSMSTSRDRDVTPVRFTSGFASASTRRATRQSATTAAAVPPTSTRSTRSTNKRPGGHDEPDRNESPSVFSFQGGDGSSATGSRAVTPTNLRPTKKQKTGPRVKLS